MRRRLFLLAALIPAIGSSGCLRDASPIELDLDPVHVHAVLDAGASTAVVLITRPPDPEANCHGSFGVPCTPPEPRWDPFVSGAEVRLIRGTDTMYLAERSGGACAFQGIYPQNPQDEGAGCYEAALPTPIQSGSEYELDIRLTDGSTIVGRTVVPAGPTLMAPAPMERMDIWCTGNQHPPISDLSCHAGHTNEPPYIVPVATVPVRWVKAATSETSQLAVWARNAYRGDEITGARCTLEPAPYFEPLSTRKDSTTWSVFSAYCQGDADTILHWDSISAEVVVTHLEPGYADYLEAISDRSAARIGKVQAGLQGALGVFGAVASDRRMIMMVRRQGSPPAP